jgi:hypothetical protein
MIPGHRRHQQTGKEEANNASQREVNLAGNFETTMEDGGVGPQNSLE